MAGPILVKLGGVDGGNSEIFLDQKKIGVIIIIKDILLYWLNRVIKHPVVVARRRLRRTSEEGVAREEEEEDPVK